jgi:translation initiation factor 1
MARGKQRIDTSGGAGLAADNPFAGLSTAGLGAGPVQSADAGQGAALERPKKRETLQLRRLKAGKGGKVVTEISGFNAAPEQIDQLRKRLQGGLGLGGTRKGKVVELQGECRDTVRGLLEAQGYTVKG